MTLFKAVDHVVKVRKVSYNDVYDMPFYEFQFLLDIIKEEAEKEEEEAEKQKSERDKGTAQYKQKEFKPVNPQAMLRKQQSYLKNIKPNY